VSWRGPAWRGTVGRHRAMLLQVSAIAFVQGVGRAPRRVLPTAERLSRCSKIWTASTGDVMASLATQPSATTLTPCLSPVRGDLMAHAQLTGDFRRDHTLPEQVSRPHAALFHRLQITPQPRRTSRFALTRYLWGHIASVSLKTVSPVVPQQSI
jgi:hypothetical protein